MRKNLQRRWKLKKKRKILSQEDGKKKKDNDDDDELDDNDDRIYSDQKNKIVPAFKTNRNGTLNELANHAYDLKKLWEKEAEVKEIVRIKAKRRQIPH